jgi:Peptidase M50B-like
VILVVAAAISIALWVVPQLRVLVYPLTLFNTTFHELSHAVATVLTGGTVIMVQVFVNGEGVTRSAGGWPFVIASAGYFGTSVLGAALLATFRDEKSTRLGFRILAGALIASLVLVIRGDFVGWTAGFLWAVALVVASRVASGPSLMFFARFLAIQLCLTSFKSLYDLLFLSAAGVAATDAGFLQSTTGIPSLFWAGTWSLASVVAVIGGLAVAWKGEGSAQLAGSPSRSLP